MSSTCWSRGRRALGQRRRCGTGNGKGGRRTSVPLRRQGREDSRSQGRDGESGASAADVGGGIAGGRSCGAPSAAATAAAASSAVRAAVGRGTPGRGPPPAASPANWASICKRFAAAVRAAGSRPKTSRPPPRASPLPPVPPPSPAPSFAGGDRDAWGPIRREKMPHIRRTIAEQMVRSGDDHPACDEFRRRRRHGTGQPSPRRPPAATSIKTSG